MKSKRIVVRFAQEQCEGIARLQARASAVSGIEVQP